VFTLTAKGRRLLKGTKQVKLTEKGSFTPAGGTTTNTTKEHQPQTLSLSAAATGRRERCFPIRAG
jgi:hypothetical protein